MAEAGTEKMTEGSAAPVCVIAEAGVNHGGDLDRARALVDAAAEVGADIVKFQAFRARDLVADDAPTAAYQKASTGYQDQRGMLEQLELSLDDFTILAEHCRACRIGFLCTAFDREMLTELVGLGMPAVKVASGEMTNAPGLEHAATFGLPVLLSTGMATLDEVRGAVDILNRRGAAAITLLHCTSLYPAPIASVNLQAMVTLRETFGLPVGYSDHTTGDHVAVAAVALGASVIEKHLTLDRNLPGPDHAASLEPSEFRTMVCRLREVAQALGDGVKAPAPGEADVARVARKSWHAAQDLPVDTVLSDADVCLKRPATGLSPMESPVGRRLLAARAVDEPIRSEDLAAEESAA